MTGNVSPAQMNAALKLKASSIGGTAKLTGIS